VVTIRPWLLPDGEAGTPDALAAPVGTVPAWASRAASAVAPPPEPAVVAPVVPLIAPAPPVVTPAPPVQAAASVAPVAAEPAPPASPEPAAPEPAADQDRPADNLADALAELRPAWVPRALRNR
jgi:hypothetical protein